MILKLIWRNITGKPFRFLLTCSAVTVGVMFTVGVFVFTDGLRATFGDLAQDLEGGVEYAVRSEVAFGDRGLVAKPVDPAIAELMAGVDGVVGVQPRILKFGTVPVDGDGEAQETTGPPNLGVNWEDKTLNPRLFIDEGRPPAGGADFALDADAFEDGNFALGQPYTVITPTGPQEFDLVGTFFFASPEENLLVGAKLVAFDTATALEVINGGVGYDQITFETAAGADPDEVAERVAAVLPTGAEVVSGAQLVQEQDAEFSDFIDNIRTFLIVFAFIILLVSAFVIYNVFTILIGQRIRELGLLRAIGASGAQVTKALIGEALIVGIFATVVGTALGIGFGWGLREVLSQLDFGPSGNDLLLKPFTFAFGAFVGIGVTLASAIAPALRARRISPMAALREDARLTRYVPPINYKIGLPIAITSWLAFLVAVLSKEWQWILLLSPVAAIGNSFGIRRIHTGAGQFATFGLGLVMLLCALVLDLGTGPVLTLVGVAAAIIFLGVNGVSPLMARSVSNVIGRWPLAILLGILGVLLMGGAVFALVSLVIAAVDDPVAGSITLLVSLPFLAIPALLGRRAFDAAFILGWRFRQVVLSVFLFAAGAIATILTLVGLAGVATTTWGDAVFLPVGLVVLGVVHWLRRSLPSAMKSNARMARENAGRSPRRTASAAAALMIGIALVSTASVVAASFKATFADILEESVTSDYFISPNQNNPNASFSSALADDLRQLDEVDTILQFQFGFEAYRTVFDGAIRDSSATDLAVSLDHLDPDFVALDESLLGREAIWIHEDMARDNSFTLGSTFDIQFPDLSVETVTVAGIYADSSIYGNRVVDLELWAYQYPASQDQFVSVTIVDGVDVEQARAALRTFTDEYPTLNVDTRDEFQDRQSAQIDQFLIVINVLLGIAIVIALLGITITLALSVFERTRELGLIRAVGMTTRQMMRMVLFEGAIIAAFGGVLGIVLGTAFGSAAVSVMPDDFIRALDIPVLNLVLYVVVAALAGIAAGIIPARRAARLNVLDAIAEG